MADSPNTTPFFAMEDGSSSNQKKEPKKPRRCVFFSLGVLTVVALLGIMYGVMKYKMDKEGVEWKMVSKDENTPVDVNEEDFVMPDDVDEGSDYTLPREPVTDADTGIPFPAILSSPDSGAKKLMALGAGVRVKNEGPLSIQVYSVCMYIDPEAAREGMSRFQGRSPSQLRSTTEFYDALRDASFDRAVRIVMKFKVSGSKMTEGLVTGISARLREYAPDRATELTAIFRQLFTESQYVPGDTLLIAQTGNRLSLTVNNDERGRGVDGEPELIRAFFAIYTDPDTPASAARVHFADRMPLLWDKKESAVPAELSVVSRSDAFTKESATDLHFTNAIVVTEKPAGLVSEMTLTGVSGRTKSIIPLIWQKPVYGVGLYVDMGSWNNATEKSAVGENIYDYIRDADDVTRAIIVQMAVGIDSGTVIKAFADVLRPILVKKLESSDDLDKALCAFRNLFTFELYAQEQIQLHCSTDGRLYSIVNEVPRNAISDKLGSPLCHALFEVYLGDKSVVGDAGRKDLVKGLK